VLVERMTWIEYEDVIGQSIVILPVGSLEQHGPHLPLNVDVVIPTSLAKMIAEQARVKAIVMPAVAYGYKSQPTSGGGQDFPGTTCVDGNTLVALAHDILREVYRDGGRKFLVITGHYENTPFLNEAIDLFIRNGASDAKVVLLNWWDQISEALVEEIFREAGFPGWDTEHAAITETSLMQYFAPELVREDKIIDDQSQRKPTYAIFPAPSDIIPNSGVLYKATYASREKGEKMARDIVNRIIEIMNLELV
jgi:creatinine amidohydrolase